MHTRLHLAAVLLTGAAAACTIHAQVQDELPTQIHSPQVTVHHKAKSEDLSWIWQYTEPAPAGRSSQLLVDPRLRPLLARSLTAPQSFWGDIASLPSTVDTALAFLAVPGRVLANDNRYVTADGAVVDFPTSRGQIFLDLNPARPLVIFSAIDWIRDGRSTDEPGAEYTLWVFPSRALDPGHIPPAFTRSVSGWMAQPISSTGLVQHITAAILVNPDGAPRQIPVPTSIATGELTPFPERSAR